MPIRMSRSAFVGRQSSAAKPHARDAPTVPTGTPTGPRTGAVVPATSGAFSKKAEDKVFRAFPDKTAGTPGEAI